MQIAYDHYGRHEPSRIYLATPSKKILCALNGIDISSVDFTGNCNDISTISFDIYEYVDRLSGKIKSNGYELVSKFMKIYVSYIGWFIIDAPEIHNDGIKEYKTINAYSAQKEFNQVPLDQWKVNRGTTDSLEMLIEDNVEIINDVEFAKENIKFCYPDKPDLSLVNILVSKVPGWEVGYVDTIPKIYESIENGETVTKKVLLSDEIGTFDVDYDDCYSFMMQDFEKYFNCVVDFDYLHFKVNFYRVENYGKDTNVVIGFRNVENSNDITVDEDNIYTRFRIAGGDNLGIEQYNGGSNYLFYLDKYWLNQKYLSQSTIDKYNAWSGYCNAARYQYGEYSKQWNVLQEEISELNTRVPVMDCNPENWENLSDEALLSLKSDYEAQKLGYEKIYVDDEGNFDIDKLNASPDANTYHQIVDTILPNIEIEIENRELPTSEGEQDYLEDYLTTWEYYGVNELEIKLQSYQDLANLLKKSHYDLSWERYQELSQSDPDKYPVLTSDGFADKHEEYLKNANQLDENTPGTCAYALKERKQEVSDKTESQEEINQSRSAIAKAMDMNMWKGQKYIGDTESEGFTQSELDELSHITNQSTYTNENIFIVSTDDLTATVETQRELCEAALEDIAVYSVPQTIYRTDLDNIISASGNDIHVHDVDYGNFIRLGLRDDYYVKLRITSMTFNPCLYDNNLSIEFSNMIKAGKKRNDFVSLLDLAGNLSQSSASTSFNGDGQITDDNIYQILTKILQSSQFSNKVQNIVNNNTGAGSGGTGGYLTPGDIYGNDGFFEYIQSELIAADQIIANSGDFKDLSALVAMIDNLLAGTVSAELGHIIELTAQNVTIDEAVIRDLIASQITVAMLKAGDISADKFNIVSDDGGMSIVGNTMQFKDKNGNLRIQIGRDANDDFTFVLYDETGEGVLIDSTGVKESAISDGLINTDMIANEAVTEDKINKEGMLEWTDNDGNKIFRVDQMYYGNDKFSVSYTETVEKVNTTYDKVEDIESKIGQIELSGDQIFKKIDDVISPESITLTATCRNGVTVGKWYINNVENTSYISTDKLSCTIPSSEFGEQDLIVVKVTDSTETLFDSMSIYLLDHMEGAKGEDGYTVILSNENIAFAVDPIEYKTLNTQSFTSSIMVYQGTSLVESFTIGDIENTIAGINISKDDTSVTIGIAQGTTLSNPSGSIRIPIIIGEITFYKDIVWNRIAQGKQGEQGEPGTSGVSASVIVIGNESQNIPCDNNGACIDNFLIEIPFYGYNGLDRVDCSVSVGVLSNGVTLGSNQESTTTTEGMVILNVAKGATLGGNDVLSGKVTLTFTINGQQTVRYFYWNKTKDGAQGESGVMTLYSVESSSPIINKNYDNTLSPTSISFSAYKRLSNTTDKEVYNGRFVISESTNGTSYSTKYTSAQDESNISYVPSSINTISIRCTLCQSGGITQELDMITVPILSSVDSLRPVIEEMQTSISGVESEVDAVNKKITDKVWQSDVTSAINNYDNTTVKTIRDQVAEHTTEIGQISSTVSDVESTLETKADGSTVQSLSEKVSSMEQDAEGFKQTVSQTYATKSELESTSETLTSTIEQTASEINQTVSDLSGNVSTNTQNISSITQRVTSAEGDISSLEQTAQSIESTITDINGNISDLEQTAESLESTIGQKQDSGMTAIRYIRDWLNGNDKDSENRWVECRVMVDDIDVAENITPVAKSASLTTLTVSNLDRYTDGQLLEDDATSYITTTQESCLELDLGQIYYDIDYIQIYHYYLDNRVCNHKLQVSSDGSSWVTLYDSKYQGGYKEESSGKTHYISDTTIMTTMTSIKQTVEQINASVTDVTGQVSNLVIDVDGLQSSVASNSDLLQSLDDMIASVQTDVANTKTEYTQSITDIRQEIDKIVSRVADVEGDVINLSEITQDADGWKALFAQLDMYDVPNVQTNISIDINGITVTNPITGQQTKMTIDEFAGYYNGEKIFHLSEDTTVTKRVYCEKGWDTGIIKMTTNTYSMSNGTTLGGVSFVISGGSS